MHGCLYTIQQADFGGKVTIKRVIHNWIEVLKARGTDGNGNQGSHGKPRKSFEAVTAVRKIAKSFSFPKEAGSLPAFFVLAEKLTLSNRVSTFERLPS